MRDDIPAEVRSTALAAGRRDWLDTIDDLLGAVSELWRVSVGDTLGGGTEAFITEATLEDGTPAVIKLLVPRDAVSAGREAGVLRACAGSGCAALLGFSAAHDALLVERLGPSLYDMGAPFDERLPILADVAAAVWRPPPRIELIDGARKAEWLIELIERAWEATRRPCSRAAVDHAVACASSRRAAHDPTRAVLVHGDVHQWNTLRARDGYKLIDPDGLAAEPEYDLGVIMREDPIELMAGDPWDRANWLAERTGCDPVAVWEWGVVERLSTGLLCKEIDLEPIGSQMLEVADRLAAD